jgi:hypothetical protein
MAFGTNNVDLFLSLLLLFLFYFSLYWMSSLSFSQSSDLSDEQVKAYQRDGYLHIRGLLPPEAVQRARAKIQEGLDRNIDKLKTWYVGINRELFNAMMFMNKN